MVLSLKPKSLLTRWAVIVEWKKVCSSVHSQHWTCTSQRTLSKWAAYICLRFILLILSNGFREQRHCKLTKSEDRGPDGLTGWKGKQSVRIKRKKDKHLFHRVKKEGMREREVYAGPTEKEYTRSIYKACSKQDVRCASDIFRNLTDVHGQTCSTSEMATDVLTVLNRHL